MDTYVGFWCTNWRICYSQPPPTVLYTAMIVVAVSYSSSEMACSFKSLLARGNHHEPIPTWILPGLIRLWSGLAGQYMGAGR